MTNLDKFCADMQRTVGHCTRTGNTSSLVQELERSFLVWTRSHGSLAENLLAFWSERYGRFLDTDESRATATERLAALMALLSGEFDESHVFSGPDWEEIREIVSAEAETMNMDTLTDIMTIIVSRHGV